MVDFPSKMVDFPIENGDFPSKMVDLPMKKLWIFQFALMLARLSSKSRLLRVDLLLSVVLMRNLLVCLKQIWLVVIYIYYIYYIIYIIYYIHIIYIYYMLYCYNIYIYIPELNRGLFMRPAALAASVYTISLYLCYKSATNNPPLLLYKDIETIHIYI